MSSSLIIAAATASPPLVIGGILIGILLLVLFLGILLRTFRSMQAMREMAPIERAQREIDDLVSRWRNHHEIDAVRALIDGLRMSEDASESRLYGDALAQITSRYFGTDGIAWEVWYRKESNALVAEARGLPDGDYLPVS